MKKIAIFLSALSVFLVIFMWVVLSDQFILNISLSLFAFFMTAFTLVRFGQELRNTFVHFFLPRVLPHFFRVFLISAILALINFFVYQNDLFIDFTTQKLNSLSEQSRKLLDNVPKNVEILVFVEHEKMMAYRKLTGLYKKYRLDLNIQYKSLESHEALAKSLGVTESGTFLFKTQKSSFQKKITNESDLTSALYQLSNAKKVKMMMSSGFGEIDTRSNGQDGGSYLVSLLKEQMVDVNLINVSEKAIPQDVEIFLIWGKQFTYNEKAISHLQDFVQRGGNLMILLGTNFTKNSYDDIEKLLAPLKLSIRNDLIIDVNSQKMNIDPSTVILSNLNEYHPITKSFKKYQMYFPRSNSLVLEEGSSVTKLMMSHEFPGSWAEANFESMKTGKVTYEIEDRKGPFPLAFSYQHPTSFSKITVFSSSHFVMNGYSRYKDNFELFMNAFDWSVDRLTRISIDRPELTSKRIFISAIHKKVVFFLVILFLPLIYGLLGFYMYRRYH